MTDDPITSDGIPVRRRRDPRPEWQTALARPDAAGARGRRRRWASRRSRLPLRSRGLRDLDRPGRARAGHAGGRDRGADGRRPADRGRGRPPGARLRHAAPDHRGQRPHQPAEIARLNPASARCSIAASISTTGRRTPSATRSRRGAGRATTASSRYRGHVELSHAAHDDRARPRAARTRKASHSVVTPRSARSDGGRARPRCACSRREYAKYLAASVRKPASVGASAQRTLPRARRGQAWWRRAGSPHDKAGIAASGGPGPRSAVFRSVLFNVPSTSTRWFG